MGKGKKCNQENRESLDAGMRVSQCDEQLAWVT